MWTILLVNANLGVRVSEDSPEITLPVNLSEAQKEYLSGVGPNKWNHSGTGNSHQHMLKIMY